MWRMGKRVGCRRKWLRPSCHCRRCRRKAAGILLATTSRCSRRLPVFGPADGIVRPEESEKELRTIRAARRRWFRAFDHRERGERKSAPGALVSMKRPAWPAARATRVSSREPAAGKWNRAGRCGDSTADCESGPARSIADPRAVGMKRLRRRIGNIRRPNSGRSHDLTCSGWHRSRGRQLQVAIRVDCSAIVIVIVTAGVSVRQVGGRRKRRSGPFHVKG